MSDASVIKEFLVSLGFKIDEGSERRFSDSLVGATAKAIELGVAVNAAAGIVVAGVAKIADNLEQLYFKSQRTNSSVEGMQAFAFAAQNMGSSAEGALGSLEALASHMRRSPGYEGLLRDKGIQTRNENGELRDTIDILGDLGKQFASMPTYRGLALADALGIDEKTFLAMREGMGEFGDEYKAMLRAAGQDSQQAAKDSHTFMVQLRLTASAFSILAQKVASLLVSNLGDRLRKFREGFIDNFGWISKAISGTVGVFLRFVEGFAALAGRVGKIVGSVAEWFGGLSEGSQAVIKWAGLILVAWRALSAGFLATPLGRVVALGLALVSLWDDYQTWKEGGKSLIDWEAWSPAIEAAIAGIKWIASGIHGLLEPLGDWRAALEVLLAYVAGAWLVGLGKAFAGVAVSMTSAIAGLATNAALLAAAGAVGYALGTAVYNSLIKGTKFGDAVGSGLTSVMAFLGNKDAQEAVERNKHPVEEVMSMRVPVRHAANASPPASPAVDQPRGIRNNNPGNLNFAGQEGATKEAGPAGRFAVFQTAQEGLDALATQLQRYAARGVDSVRAIISKYAPPSDGNNTEAYIATVSQRLGVSPNQHLNFADQGQVAKVMDSVIRVENGKNPYQAEQLASASAKSVGGRAPELHQTTTITVNGATDARGTAQTVAAAQNDVNEQLVRNTRGAIYQ